MKIHNSCYPLALVLGIGLTGAANVQAIQSGTYELKAKHSGKCLDVSGRSLTDGAAVHQWRCHGGTNQHWKISPQGSGYRLQAVHSNKCLDVRGASTTAGAAIAQSNCGSNTSQQWRVELQTDGSYQLLAVRSGLVADVSGASMDDGGTLQQWRWWGGDNQRWTLTSLELANAPQLTVTASSHDGNVPQNTLDNNLNTRWSANGDGQWIRYDLGSSHSVSALDIAFYKGDERAATFDIQVSADAASWRTVFSGRSGGTSLQPQRFSFTPTNGRYVRILGHGNNVNSWNSITVVKVTADTVTTTVKPVWSQNFESIASGTKWKGKNELEVRNGCGVNSTRCVRASYVPSSDGSRRLVFAETLPTAKAYTLNYDVMFESDFEFVKGGKLHGLGPASPTTGCKDPAAAGWSARVMWRREGVPSIYTYDQNRANRCGEDVYSETFRFQKGRYHAVSLYVRVNEPARLANGRIEMHIDGKRVAVNENVQLRGVDGSHTEISKFLFSTFHGGSDSTWSPSKTVHARFDNFAVYPGLRVRSAPGQ